MGTETGQLFGQTVRASLIFCAERQSLIVQVQRWDDVALLCLRSDLVVVQGVALQLVAVSAQGGTCLSVAAAPLHSVCMDWVSLQATRRLWCLPLLVSLPECEW